MLTPYFVLNQTESTLLITIHAPYSNIADAEVYVNQDDFRFYSSPYYLRLRLPGHVLDCDEPLVRYDADNGRFNIELIKSICGEHFNDLDLIAKFLSPQKKKRVNVKPDIQVLSSSTNTDGNVNDDNDTDGESDDSSDDWLISQEPPPLPTLQTVTDDVNKIKYGFANQLQDVFRIVKDEFRDIFDAINVEETSASDAKKLRLEAEDEQFSDDHYLCDLMEPSSQLQEVLQFEVEYSSTVQLSDEELNILKGFGNKEYLLTKEDRRIALFSLVDILFSYTYDVRTTLGETTVESAWTINKLSATLAWLQSFSDAREAVTCCIRRSLCYPLFRNWQLSLKVLDDTISILKSGNRQVLRCLLKIHELFNNSEPRYILNQLYITDYCIWLQTDNINSKLFKLSDIVLEVKNTLNKSDVGFDIEVLETAAYSALEDDLTNDFTKIYIENGRQRSPVSTSSSSSEVEDSSSEVEDSGTELDSDDDPPAD